MNRKPTNMKKIKRKPQLKFKNFAIIAEKYSQGKHEIMQISTIHSKSIDQASQTGTNLAKMLGLKFIHAREVVAMRKRLSNINQS